MAPKSAKACSRRKLSRDMLLALSLLLCLGGCANGPSDFVAMKTIPAGPGDPPVRSVAGQEELERSLEAARQEDLSGAAGSNISINEMEAIRGRQQGRVKALRQEIANSAFVSATEM